MNKFDDNKLLVGALINLTIDRTKNNIKSPIERAIHYINFLDETTKQDRDKIFEAIFIRDNEAYKVIEDEYTKLNIVKQAEQILKQGDIKKEKKTKTTDGMSLMDKLKRKGY